MNLKNRTIAVIGLGYVGLPLAVEFGKKRPVIGFDIKGDRIAELQAGHDHTLEVSAEELKEAKHLSFTANPALIRLKQPPPVALGGSADAPPHGLHCYRAHAGGQGQPPRPHPAYQGQRDGRSVT